MRRPRRPRNCSAAKPRRIPRPPRSIGCYADGCLAGGGRAADHRADLAGDAAVAQPQLGASALVAFLERFGANAKKAGWNGLLVGDMSQPRGGPMITGHASHQIGLDADIWLTPMPDHKLSREEREMHVRRRHGRRPDRLDVDPKVWTHTRTELIRTAAEDPGVERIFVNAAIKKALCREAGSDRAWLAKVRPWWGHDDHFHVRIACPADRPRMQAAAAARAGGRLRPRARLLVHGSDAASAAAGRAAEAGARLTMAGLPQACRQVLMAP